MKTIVRYHLTPVRMAIKQKSTNDKCWRGCGEKGSLLYYWWECKLVQPLWRTLWRFLKKLHIELPYDPAIPLLGIYLVENMVQKDRYTPIVIAPLFITVKTRKQLKYQTTDGWIKNICIQQMDVCYVYVYTFIYLYIETSKYIYTHTHTHTMEYSSAIKKNEITPFVATWMDLEMIILSEVSQTEKDKCYMISLICRL